MRLPGSLAETIRNGSRALAIAGFVSLALAGIAIILMPLDGRTILGIDPWIKPMKFLLSFVFFFWTMAIVLGEIRGFDRSRMVITSGIIIAMLVEIVIIAGQSLAGTTSHFNHDTPLDAALFRIMGAAIVANTGLVAWALILHLRRPVMRDAAIRLALRLGLVLFLAGSLQGFVMVARNAHTVGAPDGGPGLPVVNWSTSAGDLRAAHFVGLHGLQALPLAGWAFARLRRPATETRRSIAVVAVALAWMFVGGWLFTEAMAGKPVYRISAPAAPSNGADPSPAS